MRSLNENLMDANEVNFSIPCNLLFLTEFISPYIARAMHLLRQQNWLYCIMDKTFSCLDHDKQSELEWIGKISTSLTSWSEVNFIEMKNLLIYENSLGNWPHTQRFMHICNCDFQKVPVRFFPICQMSTVSNWDHTFFDCSRKSNQNLEDTMRVFKYNEQWQVIIVGLKVFTDAYL